MKSNLFLKICAALVLVLSAVFPNVALAASNVYMYNTSSTYSVRMIGYSSGGAVLFNLTIAPGQSATRTGTYGTVEVNNYQGASTVCSTSAGSYAVAVAACSNMYTSRMMTIFDGSDSYIVFGDNPTDCAATSTNWGASNFCAASVPKTAVNQSVTLYNATGGATGSIVAACTASGWSYNSASCSVNLGVPATLSATDGTVSNGINLTWGGVSGASGYRLQYRVQGTGTWADLYAGAATAYNWTGLWDERVFEFQVRAENVLGAGSWSAIDPGRIKTLTCAAQAFNWGPGNYCSASAPITNSGSSYGLTNITAGASGTATASCSGTTWTVSGATCTTSIAAPTSLSATDGTVAGNITVTWAAASGATGYDVQYRKAGDVTWTQATGVASGWQLATTDESTFEFQVRGKNATGAGTWSATETGFIRKYLAPIFVSQSGIPAKIGVGQSFTFSQIWQNNGAETWTGGAHGTGPYNPADTSVWGQGVTAFVGSTATGASTTTSITVTAPTTPGTYPLQRIFQKSGVAYGAPSTAVDVVVVGAPTCTAVTPNVTSTYNPNGTITVTLQGASSVESATVKAWGSIGSVDDIREYTMNLAGSTWTASIPVVNHYATGETQININAFVANSLFTPVACASTSVAFQQLPVPNVTLIPVLGTSTEIPNPGFIAKRANGEFAKAVIDLGAFNTLRAKIELLSPDLTVAVGPAQNNVSAGVEIPLQVDGTINRSDKPAWSGSLVIVRVSYADPDAAAQGKVFGIPVNVATSPLAMQVTAAGTQGLPVGVNARVHVAGEYLPMHGDFVGALRLQGGEVIRDFEATDGNGSWAVNGLDYGQLYDKTLVAVARAVPPSYVTLLEPMEFTSAPFMLPVQAPATIAATDGTREDDVQVQWTAPATGESIRYRLYRDDVEITPAGGVAATEFIDVPPQRGVTYEYRVKTMINAVTSDNQAQDTGYMPGCRAMRLIGAGVNADMSAINGMIERWGCLTESVAASSFNGSPAQDTAISGEGNYRSFSVPIPSGLADGAHVMTLRLQSKEVQNHADRVYDIPFTLNKASITINSLTILYNGMPAADGLEANSIGRFGIKMEGGSGIGFAEEVPQ